MASGSSLARVCCELGGIKSMKNCFMDGMNGMNRMNRLIFATTAFLLSALALSGGCDDRAKNPSADATTTAPAAVILQLNWVPEPEFGGMFAALQDGLYAAQGLAVEIRKGGAQVPCAQLAASGQVQFAVVSGEEVLTLREKGGAITAVFATFQNNPTGLLLHASNPIDSLEALWKSSSTIGIDPGAGFVKLLNARYGGDQLKLVPYSGALATFLATPDSVQQCFITAEPVECQLRGVAVKVLSIAPIFNPYGAVIVVNDAYLRDNPKLVDAFVRATAEGWRRYLASPERYNPAIAALNPSMTLEAMNLAAQLEKPLIDPTGDGVGIGHMTAERWQSSADDLTKIGVITGPVNVDQIFLKSPMSAP